MKKTALPKLLPLLLLVFIFFTATAQKLPDVQQVSLRAPADIKIDGKAIEWNNQFQAYNNTTHIYYTLSNDDKNLYLTVQASDPGIIFKILFGGVVFSINTSGEKNLGEAATITYPSITMKNMMHIQFGDAKAKTDSFAMTKNSELAARSKFIRVTGIKGLDTLTSIFNRDGIKAVSLFDNKLVYTYELSIELSLLGLDTEKPGKFAYNIALPGRPPFINATRVNHPGLIESVYTPPTYVPSEPNNPHGYLLGVQTDFWGEYTLAKK